MGFLVSTQWIAERVLNSIPEGLLIAAFAWLLLWLVGRQNSGTRFAVWFAALLAIAAIPFVPAVPVGGSVARAVHAEVNLPGSWAAGIFAVWALIALLAAVRLTLGLWRLRSLRRNASPISTDDPLILATIEHCRSIRPVDVCASSEVRVPTAIGFFHPVILIPEWAVAELQAEELRAIVLHEFAHLRRWDDWTNLLQKIVGTFFFFHPAVLWIERRLSLEREMACDDAVLAETGNPHLYARCLVSLAERSFLRRSIAMAQAAITRTKDTSLRLAQILDLERPKATRVLSPVVAAVAVFAGLCIYAFPNAPQLVAFDQPVAPALTMPTVPATLAYDSAPVVPKSMVIEASAHLDRVSVTKRAAREMQQGKVILATHKTLSAGQPREILLRAKQAQHRPLVVQAIVKRPTPLPPQFVVFTQSTEYFRKGSSIMSYSVWRVMLVTAKPVSNKPPNQT
ncbi:MAG: M56 family metallopeptidase [Terriglobia bacterium]|nr:M56 family metallopeptidase [Terriglobia bacterium]